MRHLRSWAFVGGTALTGIPEGLTPCGRGLRQPPGLMALGCQGSACDRLRLTGRLRAPALGSYIVPLRWRGGRPYGRHFLCRLWRRKPYNRPAGEENRPTSLRSCNGFPPCPLRGTSPASGGRTTRAYGSATYERIALRLFIVPPLSGGKVVP